MSDYAEWNRGIMTEFRANDGQVGGPFAGAPMIIVHHVGRSSGKTFETPLVYQPAADGRMYVIASAAGAPEHPQWYRNLTAAGSATVEVGDETFVVKVSELTGAERDRIYANQVAAMPGFAEYEQKTAGIRTIPVLALDRS
ncbi:MAG TPA: nitroreductase family deazaflavin-dependent oxidoreductase [Sporichthyaceae bacterium]|jgi:deazaflavin-dependent oxidoreductase (nitroreductase family)|nr:nitroreductase family deazaflavin-dependent oxidoreductase [Sporichthyaceae bacterium]